jgi:3' terminal RNA ribose 2'-O-methyltransferase Hen1
MLLTIATTHEPANDLGYLLHKNPVRAQAFDLSFGRAHVFYPEATPQRCTAALLLDVDPIGLVRNRHGPAGNAFALEQYVNDRPYVASSMLSVAIGRVFGSALAGRCKDRPDLAERALPLTARVAVLPCRGGPDLLERLFGPLGYRVAAQRHPLDTRFPEWGDSPYHTVELERTCRLAELLSHLYVLLPVLDNDKHYWVGDDEVEKLLRHGEAWLPSHPDRELITSRYLKHQRRLTRAALERLLDEDQTDPDAETEQRDAEASAAEALTEKGPSLNEQRLEAVLIALAESGATSVLDLGCGEGNLLRLLLKERQFTRIVGVDVSQRALERAAEKLRLEPLPDRERQRIELLHGSLLYRDRRLSGFDAAAVVEVVEHFDPPRLTAFERALFSFARPGTVVLTTPNAEYNVLFPTLPAGNLRHRDHRFEWTRKEFQAWAQGVAARHGYEVQFRPVGKEDPQAGPPTQMAVFRALRSEVEAP